MIIKKGKKEWNYSLHSLTDNVNNLKFTLINLYGENPVIERACSSFLNKVVKTNIQKKSKKVFPTEREVFDKLTQIEVEEMLENIIVQDFLKKKLGFEKEFWKKEHSDKLWIPKESDTENVLKPLGTENTKKEITVSRKIRIYPSHQQKQIFKKWMHTSRFVYNRCLKGIENGEKINFQSLRNKYITKKSRDNIVNPIINEWEILTPKDVRAGTIKTLETNFKSAFTNLKRCNIERFKVGYKKKKNSPLCVLTIPKSSIKIVNNRFHIYPCFKDEQKQKLGSIKKCKEKITDIISDSLLFCDKNGDWYISTCIKKPVTKLSGQRICALDPGVRKFQTLYGEKEVRKFTIDHQLIKKIKNRISTLQTLRTKGNPYKNNRVLKRSSYIKKVNRCWKDINNQVNEMHYKTINYLTTHYNQIYLPIFESQEMVKGLKNKDTIFKLLNLKHYLFQCRLIEKGKQRGSTINICTEEYTSKTCTMCGKLNDKLGSCEIFKCPNCELEIDRDVNGARNIFLKNHFE